MKVIFRDLRHGVIKLKIENLDDLWYLSQILRPGDVLEGKTYRRVKSSDDRVGSDERRPVTLSIVVDKTEFASDSNMLRASGVIGEGPEDVVSLGSHHTFNIEKDSIVAIKKGRWLKSDISRIKDAETSALRPKVLVVVVDEGEANAGLIRESKVDYYEVSRPIGGKYDTRGRVERKTAFYSEVADLMLNLVEREHVSNIILAGAGFEKEHLQEYLSEKQPQVSSKIVLENIGSHGRAGIIEVMKRPVLKKIAGEAEAAESARLVDLVLEHVGRDDGLGLYGFGEVEKASQMGAVETLLVSDRIFMEKRMDLEPVIENTCRGGGRAHIVNHREDAGKQLEALGGVACTLRFRIR